jgi:hypothetical protein
MESDELTYRELGRAFADPRFRDVRHARRRAWALAMLVEVKAGREEARWAGLDVTEWDDLVAEAEENVRAADAAIAADPEASSIMDDDHVRLVRLEAHRRRTTPPGSAIARSEHAVSRPPSPGAHRGSGGRSTCLPISAVFFGALG